MLFLSICECIFACLKVCLCLSEYTNICVCFCPRACLCVCGKAREQPTLCRLCTSCVGHVEEDVSGGHVLAAGREEGSPVLCLEAQTLGVALRTAQSCVCVCTCVSEKSFSMKTSGAVAVQVFIKSDKRVNTLTPRKTHTHTHCHLIRNPLCWGLSSGVSADTQHAHTVLSLRLRESLTPSLGVWFSSDTADGFDLWSGEVTQKSRALLPGTKNITATHRGISD